MTVEGVLPPVAVIVAELERAPSSDERKSANKVLALLLELHDSNLRQWDLEDETRVSHASDSVVANAKRAIDKLNLTRHRLMEKIDAAVHDDVKQSVTAPLATESPAMVFDRLSVLVIRIARTTEKAGSDPDGADGYGGRLPTLRRQLDSLSAALDSLLRDVRAGTRRFLPYEHLKLYSAQPAPSRRDGADSPPG